MNIFSIISSLNILFITTQKLIKKLNIKLGNHYTSELVETVHIGHLNSLR